MRLIDAKLLEVAAPSVGVPSLQIEQRPTTSLVLWLGHGSAAALRSDEVARRKGGGF
jgi:hypothetical protein